MPKSNGKWSNRYYVTIYQLAAAGASEAKIAGACGVSEPTFRRWRDSDDAVMDALERGRDRSGKNGTFLNYVYKRLPPRLQIIWDEIMACQELPNGIQRITALLDNGGKRTKQHLWIHALVHANFNPSGACRLLNIPRSTLDGWIANDPDFAELVDEIHWHKGNFFEEALKLLVDRGDSPATIFANKTFNRDRGYAEKVAVEHTHTGRIEMNVVSADVLDALDIDVRKQLLKAVRHHTPVIVDAAAVEPK